MKVNEFACHLILSHKIGDQTLTDNIWKSAQCETKDEFTQGFC